MKYSFFDIKKQLHTWGKVKATLPPNNGELRAQALRTVLLPKPTVTVRTPVRFRLPRLAIACLLLGLATYYSPNKLENFFTSFIRDHYSLEYATSSGNGPTHLGSKGGGSFKDPLDVVLKNSFDLATQNAGTPSTEVDTFGLQKSNADIAPSIDTREFMQTDYTATMKTRHVADIGTHTQTIIRGHGGRIDNSSIGPESGYIVFVIPQNQFASFQEELKQMIGDRFLTEQIRSYNRLTEKRSIEDKKVDNNRTLLNTQTALDTLTASHNTTMADLNNQINYYQNQLSLIKQKLATSTPEKTQLEVNRDIILRTLSQLQRAQQDEQTTFTRTSNNYRTQITAIQSQLTTLSTQDANLETSIETIQGKITIERLHILDYIGLYIPLPEHSIAYAFALLAVLVYLSDRRSARLSTLRLP